jgi:hypothetical protein
MSDLACYFDYVYQPITKLSQLVFQELISKINGGSVLDLGCGQVGHYWAMGYITKASQVSFLDYHCQNIDRLAEIIYNSDPSSFEQSFSTTVDYLKTEQIVDANFTVESLFLQLIQKTSHVDTFDFVEQSHPDQFDHILAVESIECVDTKLDFIQVLNNLSSMLNPLGTVHALILKYDKKTEATETSIGQKMEGGFNPNLPTVLDCFEASKLQLVYTNQVVLNDLHNYPEAIFIRAKKK